MDDCTAIVGTYNNLGEGGTGRRGEALFELLVAVYDHKKSRRSGDNAPGAVTISMPEPDVLEAHTGRLSQRFLARKGEFACSEGALEFSRAGTTGSNMGAWFGSSVVRVAKDEDGWLVVSRDEAGFGLLGFMIPIYMSFLNWTRFAPVTDARALEDFPKEDKVEVLAVGTPVIRRTLNGFIEFEMTATVHYALRSTDVATLQVSAVRFQSPGCVPGTAFTLYAGPLLPVTRGDGTRLVPVRLMIELSDLHSRAPEQDYVTVRPTLWSDTAGNRPRGLIRSFPHLPEFCYALRAPDSGQSGN